MNIMKNRLDRASFLYNGGLEEGLAKGEAKGIAEGLAQGETKANLAIARKMKALGDPIEKIHAVTGLPTETVERL
jgi:predicted transposase YdaD